MSRIHAAAQLHPAEGLRFEVRRTALAEAGADAALATAWVLLWLVFVLALAPPAAAMGAEPAACVASGLQGPTSARPGRAVPAGACQAAQPDPGSSIRGVAPPDPAGAG